MTFSGKIFIQLCAQVGFVHKILKSEAQTQAHARTHSYIYIYIYIYNTVELRYCVIKGTE